MKRFIIFIFLLILVLLPSVSSLGITPGRTTLNYESGVENVVHISVLNNENKNMNVFLSIDGELKDFILLSDNKLTFDSEESSKTLDYKIRMPDNLEPGLHKADIMALEVDDSEEIGDFVGATLAVISQLYVYVPCPGKCVDADLEIYDGEPNKTATLVVPVISRGKLDIAEVRAIVDIYNPLNEKVGRVETNYAPLSAGARTELIGKWYVDVNPGTYFAKINVFYDGQTKNLNKKFDIGINKLDIESILVNKFKLGEIVKLQILVNNNWNQELRNVFANLIVYNHDNQIMADVKSPSENVSALSEKELIAYWDTLGVEEGEYDGKLIVNYDKKSTEKNLALEIEEDNLNIRGVGYAIRPSGNEGVNLVTILVILVVLLIIVNIFWLINRKK